MRPGYQRYCVSDSLLRPNFPVRLRRAFFKQLSVRLFSFPVSLLKRPLVMERRILMVSDAMAEFPAQAGRVSVPLGVDDRVFVREARRCWVVSVREIELLQAEGNYTRVYFAKNQPLLYRSLQLLEKRLPSDLFLRVSRSHLINVHAIVTIENEENG
jgi:two-component system, LytTR family, response regulator